MTTAMATKHDETAEVTCYGGCWLSTTANEWYETASRDAGRRARQLRKMGLRVVTAPMGPQVTRVGIVKLTSLHVYPAPGAEYLPELPPVRIERI